MGNLQANGPRPVIPKVLHAADVERRGLFKIAPPGFRGGVRG